MTIVFTDEEKKWLVKEPFNWHVADGAPKEIHESIEKKLSALNNRDGKLKPR